MNKARGRTGILTVLGLWLALGGMAAAATRNWKNTGTDWGTAANWVENAVPVGTDTVVIPSVPTNQPTIADARSISNLTINGNNPTPLWNIGGAGTLTIDGGTVTFQTGGQALMSCNLALNGNTSFIVGPYSQPPTLWLLGTLTGTGPLNQTLLSGWNNFWAPSPACRPATW